MFADRWGALCVLTIDARPVQVAKTESLCRYRLGVASWSQGGEEGAPSVAEAAKSVRPGKWGLFAVRRWSANCPDDENICTLYVAGKTVCACSVTCM